VVTYETWSKRMGKSCPMKGGAAYHVVRVYAGKGLEMGVCGRIEAING
jgi:hypothetical protein